MLFFWMGLEQDYEGDFSKFVRVLEEAFRDIDYVLWFQV